MSQNLAPVCHGVLEMIFGSMKIPWDVSFQKLEHVGFHQLVFTSLKWKMCGTCWVLSPVCRFFLFVCEQIPIFGRFSDNLRENMRENWFKCVTLRRSGDAFEALDWVSWLNFGI